MILKLSNCQGTSLESLQTGRYCESDSIGRPTNRNYDEIEMPS